MPLPGLTGWHSVRNKAGLGSKGEALSHWTTGVAVAVATVQWIRGPLKRRSNTGAGGRAEGDHTPGPQTLAAQRYKNT